MYEYGDEGEEDDAMFAADEALLEELFFADSDGEHEGINNGFDEIITGPSARGRRRDGDEDGGGAEDGEGGGGNGGGGGVSDSISRLALEAEAELERDMAAADAAGSRDGLDDLSWKRYEGASRPVDAAWFEYDDDDEEEDELELSDSEDGGVSLHRREEGEEEEEKEGGASCRGGGGIELELRLTAHAGLISGGGGGDGVTGTKSVKDPEDDENDDGLPSSLVVIVKAGFAAGRELGRVVLDEPKASGVACVRLPDTAAAAAIMGQPVVIVLELWAPSAAADSSGRTGRASLDAGDEIFSLLFGDFDAADPSLMRGVVPVPLAELAKDLEAAEMRAEEAKKCEKNKKTKTKTKEKKKPNREGGRDDMEEEEEEDVDALADGNEGDHGATTTTAITFPLNKMAEVRNPVVGRTAGGFLGVEGRVIG